MKIPLTDGEKFVLSVVTTLLTELKHTGVITEQQRKEIIETSQAIWIQKMIDKHERFDI
jgi:hypothetical protein